MNKSLRVKLSVTLMATVLVTMITSVLVNNFFLVDYYISGKQKSLVSAYSQINQLYNTFGVTYDSGNNESGEASEDETTDIYEWFGKGGLASLSDFLDFELSLEQLSQSNNMGILLYRIQNKRVINQKTVYDMQVLFSSSGSNSSSETDVENFSIYRDYIQSEDRTEISSESEKYALQKIYVSRMDSYYIYLIGTLDNGDYIMLRASVESIQESAQISNQFFIYVTICVSCVSFLAMLFISKRFTEKIVDLAKITQKMSHLDFAQKYPVETEDEIGILGNSINTLSETLEKTLGELKSANVQLKRELEQKVQIDEMRKEFLSNVSHELKTPIALIQGYAEGLQENINDDEESREFYCEVIMDEASKMNVLVKKLLDLNQIEFGTETLTMEHFDIVSTIDNILSNAEILFRQKEATLWFNAKNEIYVWGDVYLVEEAFTNYMSNALNHVDGDKIIEVKVEKTGKVVRISVFNTGARIPKEDIEQIWVKFYKVDKARTREYGGSGVGLSIVKATMERLGQQYGVENRENGVEFWFTLDASNEVPELMNPGEVK
ncbi:ATP-binding protein [Frisingicoccus sp.]|uniref:HAMP domain-containing sensor histidine kinase n=1 Tax=Frisingicoccus sp. TaxID=1918627 RepID=UPI003AB24DBF